MIFISDFVSYIYNVKKIKIKDMGRKKIDKDTIEYISNNLFHKDTTTGFQFTSGNTPLGLQENRPLTMSCSVNYERSVVIDYSVGELESKIESEFGLGYNGKKFTLEKIKDLQEQFRSLGYEVEEGEFVGHWYWFRIKCKPEEIPFHVQRLKENLVME